MDKAWWAAVEVDPERWSKDPEYRFDLVRRVRAEMRADDSIYLYRAELVPGINGKTVMQMTFRNGGELCDAKLP